MKKQLITEAFRLQQLAGIKPVNSLKEEKGESISQAFIKAGIDLNSPVHIEVDYGSGSDEENFSTGREALKWMQDEANTYIDEGIEPYFEMGDEIIPWWEEDEVEGEAKLTISFEDASSFAIIQ